MDANSSVILPNSWPLGYGQHRPVRVAEAREFDRQATATHGIPSFVLMEHASMGVAAVAQMLAPPPTPVLVCCGPGNNGGDGYGTARFLSRWGSPVTVLQMAERAPAGGDAHLEHALFSAHAAVEVLWGAPGALQRHLEAGPGLIIDALFGVGLSRELGAPYGDWIEALNGSGVPILAIDVPSGLESDSGHPLPTAIQARATATMAAPKQGIAPGAPGAAYAGQIVEIDIGLPATHLEALRLPGAV